MIKTILIDDSKNDLQFLANLCENISAIHIENTFTSSVLAFEWLEHNAIDLIISDIEMPIINGIDMLKQLKQKPLVILVSAFPDYALSSFDIDPIHYLIKPLKMEGLLSGIERVKDRLANKKTTPEHIFVLQNKEYIKVELNDILYIKADANFVNIVQANKEVLVLSNLTQFTKQLPSHQFLRIHKTFTINSLKIEKYTTEHLVINSEIIPFGASYKASIISVLKSLSIQRMV